MSVADQFDSLADLLAQLKTRGVEVEDVDTNVYDHRDGLAVTLELDVPADLNPSVAETVGNAVETVDSLDTEQDVDEGESDESKEHEADDNDESQDKDSDADDSVDEPTDESPAETGGDETDTHDADEGETEPAAVEQRAATVSDGELLGRYSAGGQQLLLSGDVYQHINNWDCDRVTVQMVDGQRRVLPGPSDDYPDYKVSTAAVSVASRGLDELQLDGVTAVDAWAVDGEVLLEPADSDTTATQDGASVVDGLDWIHRDPHEIVAEAPCARDAGEVLGIIASNSDDKIALHRRLGHSAMNQTNALLDELGLLGPNSGLHRDVDERVAELRQVIGQ